MRTLTRLIVLSILSLVLPSSALAQPAEFQQVITVHVRPAMAPQYEEYVKAILDAANQVGDVQSWFTGQVTSGGPGRTYAVVLPFNEWAEQDSWSSIQQVLTTAHGEEEAAKIMRAGSAAVESTSTVVSRIQPGFSVHLDRTGPIASHYLVRTYDVKPDKLADFQLFMSKVQAAQEKSANTPRQDMRRNVEGPRFRYTSATAFNTYAERDDWPGFTDFMYPMYGEAESGRIIELYRQSIKDRGEFVWTYRPDLSKPD